MNKTNVQINKLLAIVMQIRIAGGQMKPVFSYKIKGRSCLKVGYINLYLCFSSPFVSFNNHSPKIKRNWYNTTEATVV